MNNALVLGPVQKNTLEKLRAMAFDNPVDARTLVARLKTADGKEAHRSQMTAQTVTLPLTYMVTFSVEINAPHGTQRHMSISTSRAGFVPNPAAVWMVAECLGFTGSLDECFHYVEDLQGHGRAVNVIQLVTHEARHV